MPESNGSHWRSEMDERMKAIDAAHKELQDAFIVMTHLQTKMSNALKEQAAYMDSHETRVRELESVRLRFETGLAEATEKINFLIDREMRREGGPENLR